MSHFTLLVVTRERPDEGMLEELLQPWHEYECTGIDDDYVIDVDETGTVHDRWAEIVEAVQLADGTLARHSDPRFWSEAGGKPRLTLPHGARVVNVPRCELEAANDQTIESWASAYGGWTSDGAGNFYTHTNPEARWDWWVVGGRWSGFFRLKPGVSRVVGQPGAFGPMREGDLYADCARLVDIDIETMQGDSVREVVKAWHKAREVTAGLPQALAWADLKSSMGDAGIEAVRAAYWQQPAVKALQSAFPTLFEPDTLIESVQQDRETIIARAKAATFAVHAYLKDGYWHEQGEMGWFGISRDEQPVDQWNTEVAAMVASLDPSVWLTLVDCHI